jgi:hypothetical protein
MKLYGFLVISGAILILANPAAAQIQPSKESLSDLYHGKAYSPYAQRPFPSRPLWGDTHLHTGLSVDAGLFGARLGLEEAYQFARGEEVVSSTGQPVKLSRPLDWLVITDHSDAMGFVQDLAAGDPGIGMPDLSRGERRRSRRRWISSPIFHRAIFRRRCSPVTHLVQRSIDLSGIMW